MSRRTQAATRNRSVTVATPAEQQAEAEVGRIVRRMNEQMSTFSRSMMAGTMATPRVH